MPSSIKPVERPTFPGWEGYPSFWNYSASIFLSVLTIPLIVGIFTLLACIYRQLSLRFSITPSKVMIEVGIFVKSSRELRIADIRSINVRRRGLGGFFGLGDVEFASAAHDSASVTFGGLRRAGYVADIVRALQDGREPALYEDPGTSAWSILGKVAIGLVAVLFLASLATGVLASFARPYFASRNPAAIAPVTATGGVRIMGRVRCHASTRPTQSQRTRRPPPPLRQAPRQPSNPW